MMRMCGRGKEVNTPELISQSVRVKVRVTMLRFLGGSGRDSVGKGQHSSNRVSGSFPPGQYTNPLLHPCHRLFDQDGHEDSSCSL